MTTGQTIAVLGLGRMGGAMAGRLASQGWSVVGWTRAGRTPTGLTVARNPSDAVAAADVVLLSLFDGAACRDVLETIAGSLRPGTVVLNTSTIAVSEASELARRFGASYIQAPVLGSVPAAAAGALQILAAADGEGLDQVRPVLETLGTVLPVGQARTAAALKLVANHSLAGALAALGDSLRQADALGLSRQQALAVLERGQLGGLVARKRPYLLREPVDAPAQFSVDALAKDMALLAAASGAPLRSARSLAGTRDSEGDGDADVAALATAPAAPDAVLAPLRSYMRGHATGDPQHFRDAFMPTARIEGLRAGALVSWNLDDYCDLFSGRPAPDESARSRRIDAVDVTGTVATATMTLAHGPDTFTDLFLLILVDDNWRIANKVYHRHACPFPRLRPSRPDPPASRRPGVGQLAGAPRQSVGSARRSWRERAR
ncbi:nuclear transport factor 2 family protein [Streptomyces sp. NPDC090127]|uniref:nuclear transport factor 2 family protein n=1 Tax=Streptomyces sp. NPDC090127 TaxID=3365953 RepID=UPI003814B4C6